MKKMRKYSVLLLLCFLICAMMPVSASAAAKLNKKSITVNVKKTYTLKVTGTSGKVTWSSSNKKIATVSSKGVVKGVKKGTATVTAKVGKKKYTCKVTVKQPVTSIKLNKKTVSLKVGKTVTLKATVSPTTANTKTVTWSSSNKKIATVSSKGVVKAVGNGTATITATAKDGSGKKASCKITVGTQTVTNPKITTISLSLDNISKYITIKTQKYKSSWDEEPYTALELYWNDTNAYCISFEDFYCKAVVEFDYVDNDGNICHDTATIERKNGDTRWYNTQLNMYNVNVHFTVARGTLQLIQKADVASIERGTCDEYGRRTSDGLLLSNGAFYFSMFRLP